jgi:hypothetical protein
MANSTSYNLPFTATVGTQNRIVIDPKTVKIADIKEGNIVFLVLTCVHKGA